MRYRAIIAYDGTAYLGFQKLPDGQPTVLGTISKVIGQINGANVRVLGAGRTDAGVHATGQVIAFDLPTWKHSVETLLQALNATLPTDIAILRLEHAQPDFHPRFEARSRTYRYLVYEAPIRHPMLARSHWHIRPHHGQLLDVDKMKAAAAQLIGTHDFASVGTPPDNDGSKSTVRDLFRSEWRERPHELGRELAYTIEANAFLYHMVRTIVQALVDVGAKRLTLDAFNDNIQAKDRTRFGKLAPAHGLTLISVSYDDGGTTPAGDNQHDI
jgi:tRNA pseudouridine38-40 synthase